MLDIRIPGTAVSLSYSQSVSTVGTLEKTFVSNKYSTIICHLNAVFKPAIGLMNWLFLSEYTPKCTILSQKVKKKLGETSQPLWAPPQTSPPMGRGTLPHQISRTQRLRRLDTPAFVARPVPPIPKSCMDPSLTAVVGSDRIDGKFIMIHIIRQAIVMLTNGRLPYRVDHLVYVHLITTT